MDVCYSTSVLWAAAIISVVGIVSSLVARLDWRLLLFCPKCFFMLSLAVVGGGAICHMTTGGCLWLFYGFTLGLMSVIATVETKKPAPATDF